MADTPAFAAPDKSYILPGKEFKEQNEGNGFIVVLHRPYELQIDIDSARAYDQFIERFDELNSELNEGASFQEHPSKSGYPRRHITVTMPFEMDHLQRIAFQAALGSDTRRELLSLIQLMRGDDMPVLFLEKEGR